MENLSEILNKHAKFLRGELGGERANLRGADLRGANLEGANLGDTNLRGADLRDAYLRGANLRGANLRGAYLRGANLEGAYLRGANLEGADLRGADLRGSLVNHRTPELYLKSILGLTYNILIHNEMVTVGCQQHPIVSWFNFTPSEISAMDGDKATQFYPLLLKILEHEVQEMNRIKNKE